MKLRFPVLFFLVLVLLVAGAAAKPLDSLPMDSTAIAPPPKDECFLSDREYKDDTISVKINEGDYLDVHYWCARVKIAHPSQFRTVPARQVDDPNAVFAAYRTGEAECTRMAAVTNAVIAVNGDYCNDNDRCQVMLRQGLQVRNMGNGSYDVLIVDNEGDFDVIPNCQAKEYVEYYDAHPGEIYQAFCFGPAMVKDDAVIVADKANRENANYVFYNKPAQRMGIIQVGDLDYLLVTSDGDAQMNRFGLTIPQFADLCLKLGREASPEGARLAYNLDGGNSSSLVFKVRDNSDNLVYTKLNMPERDRKLADMICFVSLE